MIILLKDFIQILNNNVFINLYLFKSNTWRDSSWRLYMSFWFDN